MYDGSDVGYLTYEQFSRFRRAVHYSLKLVPWLRVAGYIKTGNDDGVHSGAVHPPLGVPPTWVAAEDITRLSQELNAWPDLEDIAADDYGAEVAVEFTREVETAAHKWPFEDRPHGVQFVRCPGCHYASLRYEPPRFGGDAISVRCRECARLVSEEEFSTLTALIAAEFSEVKGNERRLGHSRTGNGENEPVEADNLPLGLTGEGENDSARSRFVA